MKECCPVCGFVFLNQDSRLPYCHGEGSFDICPCCRFEYAVSDDNYGYTFEMWRWLWIRDGAIHCSRNAPEDYDAAAQLLNIGIDIQYYQERQDPDDPVVQTIAAGLARIRKQFLIRQVRGVFHVWNPKGHPDRFPDYLEEFIPEAVALIEACADLAAIGLLLHNAERHMGVSSSETVLSETAASLHALEQADLKPLWCTRV